MNTAFRVAAVQCAPAFLDLEGTLDLVADWSARASREGARLVAFPETFVPGYPAWVEGKHGAAIWNDDAARQAHDRLVANSIEIPSRAMTRLGEIARQQRVAIVVGVHERSGRALFDAQLTFGPDGAPLNHHRKLIPTQSERLVWRQGDAAGLNAVDVGGARVGGLVCWEHWMPLARQTLHDAGEQVHVAAWPSVNELHHLASRHYAFEGRCFVIAAGGLMRMRDLPRELPPPGELAREPEILLYDGGTTIFAPDGRTLAGPCVGEESLLIADCDLREIDRESTTRDGSRRGSRPDVFELRVRRERR